MQAAIAMCACSTFHGQCVACSGAQAAPSQPLLLLATCHCDPSELPAALLGLFGSQSSTTEDGALPDNVILLTEHLPQAPAAPAGEPLDMQQALAGAP